MDLDELAQEKPSKEAVLEAEKHKDRDYYNV